MDVVPVVSLDLNSGRNWQPIKCVDGQVIPPSRHIHLEWTLKLRLPRSARSFVSAVELLMVTMTFADPARHKFVRQSARLTRKVQAPARMVPPNSSTPRSSRSL